MANPTPEYLRIEPRKVEGRKTLVFTVWSSRQGSVLGRIVFRPGWRQYVFEPEYATVWSAGCMAAVEAKLDQLNAARRT